MPQCFLNLYFVILSHFRPLDEEYWEGDELYYECIDTTLGIDASADNFKKYKCKIDKPKGRYNTPRTEPPWNETWPICQPKTTTVKPRK